MFKRLKINERKKKCQRFKTNLFDGISTNKNTTYLSIFKDDIFYLGNYYPMRCFQNC